MLAGESTDPTMDTCEPWTASSSVKTPVDEWADFDTFAAQRVSHASDASDADMKVVSQTDTVVPVESKSSEPMSSDSDPLSPPPAPEVTNMEQQPIESSEK